jgi:hypothetical protein
MRATYWIVRSWIFAYGFLNAGMQFFGSAFASNAEASEPHRAPYQLVLLAMAGLMTLSYLLPFRLGIDTPLYFVRCGISTFWVGRALYLAGQMALGVFGPKHWAIYPVMAIMALTDAAAIALLSWRRHQTWRYAL